jgi:hypothetical protein
MRSARRKHISTLSPSDGILLNGRSRIQLEASVADTVRTVAAQLNLSLSELIEKCLLAFEDVHHVDVHVAKHTSNSKRCFQEDRLSPIQKDIVDAFRMMCLLYSKKCDVADLYYAQKFYDKSGSYEIFVQIVESYVSQSEKESCSFTDMNTIGFNALSVRARNNIKWTPEIVREDLKNLQEANRQDLQSPTSSPSEPEEALVPSVQPSSESLSPSEEPQDSDLP